MQTSQSTHSVSYNSVSWWHAPEIAYKVIWAVPPAFFGSYLTSKAWRALLQYELGHFDNILTFNKKFNLKSETTEKEKRFLVKYGKTIDTILRRAFFCVAIAYAFTQAVHEAQ